MTDGLGSKITHRPTHTRSAGLLPTSDQHVVKAAAFTKLTKRETPVARNEIAADIQPKPHNGWFPRRHIALCHIISAESLTIASRYVEIFRKLHKKKQI